MVELAKAEFIQAAVLLHPSFVTLDDIKGMGLFIIHFYLVIYNNTFSDGVFLP